MARPRLTRDTENQKIAGVCAGLARYFDIDPVLVRILFVVFIFVGGSAPLAYVLLWLIVDAAPTAPAAPPTPSTAPTPTSPAPPSEAEQAQPV